MNIFRLDLSSSDRRYNEFNNILNTGIDFTSNGYTLITIDEVNEIISIIVMDLAMNKTGDINLITDEIKEMAEVKIQGLALWYHIHQYHHYYYHHHHHHHHQVEY